MMKGDFSFLTHGNVLGVRYKDKKNVYFLSTIHNPKLVATKKTD